MHEVWAASCLQEKQLKHKETTCNRMQQERDKYRKAAQELESILDTRDKELQAKDITVQVGQRRRAVGYNPACSRPPALTQRTFSHHNDSFSPHCDAERHLDIGFLLHVTEL